jgi:hypothetical protein
MIRPRPLSDTVNLTLLSHLPVLNLLDSSSARLILGCRILGKCKLFLDPTTFTVRGSTTEAIVVALLDYSKSAFGGEPYQPDPD